MSIISYGKKYGIKLMLILPLVIVLMLLAGQFQPDNLIVQLAVIIWFFLFLNSIAVSLSGYSLASNFNNEVKRLERSGFPISSTEGFSTMYGKIRTVFSSSFLISVVVLISFVTFSIIVFFNQILTQLAKLSQLKYLLGPTAKPEVIANTLQQLILLIAISLILIAIGISLLVSLPDAPALIPGSLMKYYNPVSMPSQIDNFLSDTIFPFLDPVTRTKWDEWSHFILKNLNADFESNEDPQTKLEIAREKILLFAYLNFSMSEAINPEITKKELSEMFTSPNIIERIFNGEESGITWEILLEIINKVQKKAPEIFNVIDRLIIELTDNLKAFKYTKLFITTTSPSKVMGNMRPFRLLVFMLNKDSVNFGSKKRPVQIKLVPEGSTAIPDIYELHLDEAEGLDIHSESLKLIADGEDIVGLLSRILQVGDAVWFQVYRHKFGIHLFNVRVAEEGKGSIYGKSVEINVNRDFKFYIQQYGGKLSAIVGAILPVVGIGLKSFI